MDAVLVAGGAVLAAVTSAYGLRGEKWTSPRPAFQPGNGAFGIWSVIFGYTFVYAAGVYAGAVTVDARDLWSFTLAYVLSSVWAFLYRSRRYALSAACLAAAAAAASVHAFRYPADHSARFALRDAASGLLAGWLWVAALLGVGIVLLDRFPNASFTRHYDTPRTLGVAGLAMACACIVSRSPVPMLPVLWAAANL